MAPWEPVAAPGILLSGLLLLAVRWPRPARDIDAPTRDETLLLGLLALTCLTGWGVRPMIEHAATAWSLGIALLIMDTVTHAALVRWGMSVTESHRAPRWFRAIGWSLIGILLGLAPIIALTPTSLMGRVGPLDGVPGLYRLDAGWLAGPWAAVALAARAHVLFAVVAQGRRADPSMNRRAGHIRLAGVAVSTLVLLVWFSNPIVIALTGAAYLPGPIRFTLPLISIAALGAGVALSRQPQERHPGTTPLDPGGRRTDATR